LLVFCVCIFLTKGVKALTCFFYHVVIISLKEKGVTTTPRVRLRAYFHLFAYLETFASRAINPLSFLASRSTMSFA